MGPIGGVGGFGALAAEAAAFFAFSIAYCAANGWGGIGILAWGIGGKGRQGVENRSSSIFTLSFFLIGLQDVPGELTGGERRFCA